jgi:hypothetical protein
MIHAATLKVVARRGHCAGVATVRGYDVHHYYWYFNNHYYNYHNYHNYNHYNDDRYK